jgi:beta-xylosidase
MISKNIKIGRLYKLTNTDWEQLGYTTNDGVWATDIKTNADKYWLINTPVLIVEHKPSFKPIGIIEDKLYWIDSSFLEELD